MREPVNDVLPTPPPPQALLERLKDYGQEDAFALWDELSPDERQLLVKDIEVIFLRSLCVASSVWYQFPRESKQRA